MGTHGGLKRIIAFSFIFLGCSTVVYAGSTVIYSGDFDLPILDRQDWGSPLAEAIINIPDHLTIYDLDVGINVTHTNVFDLQIFIQSPGGTRLCLNVYDSRDDFFKGEDYVQTIFDDEAEIPIEQGSAPFTGRFRPKAGGLLQVFDGEDAYGLWRLQLYDLWYWDTGSLENVELIISMSEPAIVVPEPAALTLLAIGVGLMTLFRSRHA
jgi:subtilisin-like proprotein convertase family protein